MTLWPFVKGCTAYIFANVQFLLLDFTSELKVVCFWLGCLKTQLISILLYQFCLRLIGSSFNANNIKFYMIFPATFRLDFMSKTFFLICLLAYSLVCLFCKLQKVLSIACFVCMYKQ